MHYLYLSHCRSADIITELTFSALTHLPTQDFESHQMKVWLCCLDKGATRHQTTNPDTFVLILALIEKQLCDLEQATEPMRTLSLSP